ncbi:MAG: hypothetical protein CMK56_06535 [Proteobacteria bacterium]|nr:hypothetical protein [Pseudomonadota bacterium]
MASFGVGEIAFQLHNMGMSLLLLFYYQQVIGLSGTLTGAALMMSMVVDAITDPLIGGWSDRFKSRFGRRHPFILASSVPLAISFVLLFSPPESFGDTGNFIWLAVFSVLVKLSVTFYYVPHMALGAEMAQDYNQRSTLFAFNGLIGATTAATTHFLIYMFVFPTTETFDPGMLDPDGYPRFAWGSAIIITAALAFTVWGTRREIPYLRNTEADSRLSFGEIFSDMVAMFKNRNFFILFIATFLIGIHGGVQEVFQIYLVLHFWEFKTEEYGWLGPLMLTAFLLAFLITPSLTKRFDKKRTLVFATSIQVFIPSVMVGLRLLEVPWFPANDSDWILILFFATTYVQMMCNPVAGATIFSMFADIADEHELHSGKRREGAVYAARAFSSKALAGVGTMIGGVLLDVIQFPSNADAGSVSAEIVWRLGFIAGPAISMIALLGIGLFFYHNLNRSRHAEISRQLAERKSRHHMA